ncbi:phytase [Pleionea litopenaei]|uniref:Phytase n=1 Tax=Pleionea litopenaei TaxID=3070815 RepID=A0AA51RVQ1_9GAMM|nr:phytase [Pleionea sp. HL-JVS1]WMS88440.1 phytase [Pleionea sp. HL-JVS1]
MKIRIYTIIVVTSLALMTACQSKKTDKGPLVANLNRVEFNELSSLPLKATDVSIRQHSIIIQMNPLLTLQTIDEEGIALYQGKRRLAHLPGRYEEIKIGQSSANSNRQFFVIALNQVTGYLDLFLIKGEQLSFLRSYSNLVNPEQFCINVNKDHYVSIVAIDDIGIATEVIAFDFTSNQSINKELRRMAVSPQAEACAIDSINQLLYVAEEDIGVWKYSLNAESDGSKTPVLMNKPLGSINANIEALAVRADRSLLISLSNGEILLSHHQHQISAKEVFEQNIEKLFIIDDQGTEIISAHQEQNSHYYSTSFTHKQQSDSIERNLVNQTENIQTIINIVSNNETDEVGSSGDAADDPAIWINPNNLSQSLILGTDKKSGLNVFDLNGKSRQKLKVGRLNNVDVFSSTNSQNTPPRLIAASNRSNNSISFFTVDKRNQVIFLSNIPTTLSEVYGLCVGQNDQDAWVFINDKDGRYQQYRIDTFKEKVNARLVNEFALPSQPEGCTFDPETSRLYMGEEKAGIWVLNVNSKSQSPEKIIEAGNGLVPDVEGMEIYRTEKEKLLVVSSQGNDSYMIYDLNQQLRTRLNFKIIMNIGKGIDGVSETDGLTVTSSPLPGYPAGILIVQDGRNRLPEQTQNFKIIDWRSIQKALN